MIHAPKMLLVLCVIGSAATFIEPAQIERPGSSTVRGGTRGASVSPSPSRTFPTAPGTARSAYGNCGGVPGACDDRNPCTEDRCDPYYGCQHDSLSGGRTACGVGPCRREVTTCVGGVPQTCEPGPPSVEICNAIDDDCDGATDDGAWLFVGGHRRTCRYD